MGCVEFKTLYSNQEFISTQGHKVLQECPQLELKKVGHNKFDPKYKLKMIFEKYKIINK